MSQQTVTINGTVYDAHTGLPIQKTPVPPVDSSQIQPSQSVHHTTQKSQTLNRRIVQQRNAPTMRPKTHTTAVQKSPAITKFAPHPAGIKQSPRLMSDIGPTSHPIAAKVHQQLAQAAAQQNNQISRAPKPSKIIKQEAIEEAMQKAPSHNRKESSQKHGKKFHRLISVGSVSLALLLLGSYFTYLNMPNLSVRVAAAQAGLDATYPEYRPDGYSLSGAVAYSQGQVSMKFASNSGSQNFTINQSKSNWDSSAVLDNYIKDKAGDNYITYNERGLTVYTYGSNAAWVNGGILYTINGDAPLSSDQIRRIATSL